MKKSLELVRYNYKEASILGRLGCGGERICYTLENAWHDNQRRISCIPEGEYQVKLRKVGGYYNLYKKRWDMLDGVLELQDVPNRKYILIHCGNTAGDTAGCILVGGAYSDSRVDSYRGDIIYNSRKAYVDKIGYYIKWLNESADNELFLTVSKLK